MFSLDGRCHGLALSQENTGTESVWVISRWRAISLPWSQVSDRRRPGGSPDSAPMTASRTASAVCQPGRYSKIVNREVRSTRVPIADRLSAPVIRSPSQCPGSLRSAAAAGR